MKFEFLVKNTNSNFAAVMAAGVTANNGRMPYTSTRAFFYDAEGEDVTSSVVENQAGWTSFEYASCAYTSKGTGSRIVFSLEGEVIRVAGHGRRDSFWQSGTAPLMELAQELFTAEGYTSVKDMASWESWETSLPWANIAQREAHKAEEAAKAAAKAARLAAKLDAEWRAIKGSPFSILKAAFKAA